MLRIIIIFINYGQGIEKTKNKEKKSTPGAHSSNEQMSDNRIRLF